MSDSLEESETSGSYANVIERLPPYTFSCSERALLIVDYSFGFLVFLVLWPAVVACVILALVVKVLWNVCTLQWCRIRGRGARPLAPADRVWLQQSSTNSTIISALVVLEPLMVQDLKAVVMERLIEACNEDGDLLFPRLQLRVSEIGTKWCWESVDFDIDEHVYEAPAHVGESPSTLQQYLCGETSTDLDRSLPLWQMQVVEEYNGKHSAILFRVHHCVADGISLIKLLLKQLVDQDATEVQHVGMPSKGALKACLTGVTAVVQAPWRALKTLLRRADRNPIHGVKPSGKKVVAWSEPVRLEDLKDLKNAFGCTLNDVLLALVSGALQRYMARRDHAGPCCGAAFNTSTLTATVPFSLRSAAATRARLENHFSPVFVQLPVGDHAFRERLLCVRAAIAGAKRTPAPYEMWLVAQLVTGLLPGFVSKCLTNLASNKCSMVLSNVPGPKNAVCVGERRVEMMAFWVPQRSWNAVGLSIFSYNEEVRIGVYSDAAVMERPQDLVELFKDELHNVQAFYGLSV